MEPKEQNRPAPLPGAPDSDFPVRVLILKRTRILPIVLAVIFTALLTFAGTLWYAGHALREAQLVKPVSNPQPESSAWERKLTQVKQLIDAFYIGQVEEDKLADAAAAGMIDGLGDEWSYYISAENLAAYEESVNNAYVGIGVTISAENVEQGIEIVDVTPGSPAELAGLETGDLILAVEGVPVLDGSPEAIDIEETKRRVRGAEGTQVTLTVSHQGQRLDVTITRATIKTVNVTWELLENGLAYLRIRNFEQDAAKDTKAAIGEALAQGATGLIFDVRYNPGGYKHELVEILDELLPAGPLFRSVDYLGKAQVDYSDDDCLELPMAVLVNYNSYSAAEFFAVALQEYEAAVIVGEQTYGKGRFQTALKLDDGSALNLSIGRYTTPNGVDLVGKGVTPDYPVPLTEEQEKDLYYSRLSKEDDPQLQKAIELLTP